MSCLCECVKHLLNPSVILSKVWMKSIFLPSSILQSVQVVDYIKKESITGATVLSLECEILKKTVIYSLVTFLHLYSYLLDGLKRFVYNHISCTELHVAQEIV